MKEIGLITLVLSLASACAAPSSEERADAATAPSFDQLFSTYFDRGTPGHCATAGCHADPAHNVWLCSDKDTCYRGMIDVGLIDMGDPSRSEIADAKHSPLTWINPRGGTMPLDAQGPNASARAAIDAWVAAGVPKD